ncbi:MAG: 50S ribosomal protein L25/general stress protein Ctc, partial [Gammaproteobacteria bacterium]|nr:50S ribosomal protein L25/general stress protein Ctc [Gammaproteobacteria bacterium]
MTQTFVVEAEPRVAQGTGASRRLRRTGKIPAIIYGGNDGPQNITISHNELLKQLKVEAFYAHILTIELEGKKVQAVLKDLQRHPVRDEVYHADFQRVVADQVLRKSVPLHFIGEDVAPGIKLGGGMIEHFINEVEIECLPADLPEFIAVDVSKLALGEVIHLADLSLPQGVTLIELKH